MTSRMTSIRIDTDTDLNIDRLKEYYDADMSKVIRKSIKLLTVYAAAKEQGLKVHVIGGDTNTIIEII